MPSPPRVPNIRAFALLGAAEAAVRGLTISALPLAAYAALGDAATLSALYAAAGVAALGLALVLPALGRRLRRRTLYLAGLGGFALAGLCGAAGGAATGAAVVLGAGATVIATVCFNAYLMERVPRAALGEAEALRLFWSGPAWLAGPFLGVWLMTDIHPAAPFLLSAVGAAATAALFLRLGFAGPRPARRAASAHPLAHLGRFARQPRLVAGWCLATTRSCGWMAFYIYVPVYAVQSGLGEKAGGLIVSAGAAFLLAAPLFGRLLARIGVRAAVVAGFAGGAAGWALAAALAPLAPVGAAGALLGAAACMALLDLCAGLPFLAAVRPAQRDEMAAIYATFRETSLVATPAVGGAILAAAPLPAVFLAVACGYGAAALAARRLPRRLGRPRPGPAALAAPGLAAPGLAAPAPAP